MAHTPLENKFAKNYIPLIRKFIEQIESVSNLKGIPEPFLPVYGNLYEKAATRILFMGLETRNSCNLQEFVKNFNQDPLSVLKWFEEEFDNLEFVHWRASFGRDFWSFNLRFLAHFYDVEDWKDLYHNPDDHSEILKSFAWANADSIERYHVTAENEGVEHQDWLKVKNASLIFDRPNLIFNTLEPHLVIFLYWNKEEEWLLEGLEVSYESEPHEYLWHYYFEATNTHLFWTRHPIDLSFKQIDYDTLIEEIINIYRNYNKLQ